MFIKCLLKLLPFILLIYNISNNLEASNTTVQFNDEKSIESDSILKNKLNSNKSKEKNSNDDGDIIASNSTETEVDSNTNDTELNIKDYVHNKTKYDNNTKDSSNNKSAKHSNIENSYNNKDEDEDEESDDNETGSNNDEDDDADSEQSEENDDEEVDSEEEDDDLEQNDGEEEDLYADQDPFEKWNRKIHAFNDKMSNMLDEFSKNKGNSKQSFISKGIGNFAHNFFELPRVINYGLQGNIKNMSNTIARLIINTAFGFFGATDIAEKLGFPKNRTYFGDTLKKWGMKPGPYVVLPILGPTSLRGAVGQAFESLIPQRAAILPLRNIKTSTQNTIFYAIYCSSLLATRSAYGDMIKQVSAMSKDKYKTFRNITMSIESN